MALNEILAALDDVPDTESGRVFREMLLELAGSAYAYARPDVVTWVFEQLQGRLRKFSALVSGVEFDEE